MSILASAGFLWGEWLLGNKLVNHHNAYIFHGLVVFLVITVLSILYRLSLKSVEEEVIPAEGVTIKNIMQTGVSAILNLMRGAIKHHAEDYVGLIGAVFIFIFLSNLMGIVPGFLPPTESFITNFAVAVCVFFYYHYMGVARTGIKSYISHFLGPVWWMAPIMLVIEIVSHCIRPLSLTLRLFGNINGDHLVLGAFSGLIPLVIPVIFLGFGIFVSFIQAFVFTLLSTIYVGLAVETHDDH